MFGFAHKMDMNKVLCEGPWRYNKHFLLLKEVFNPNLADRSLLKKLPIWVHIKGVPPMWLTVHAGYAIGEKVGEVIEVDRGSEGIRGLGYLKVRIAIEAGAPLPRGLKIGKYKAAQLVKFLYEHLENYCHRCGYLDHIEEDCPKTYEEPKDENDIGWAKIMSATPPIKKMPRQFIP